MNAEQEQAVHRLVEAWLEERTPVDAPAPVPAEIDYAQTYLAQGNNRAERAQDLMWALLNSNAFLFNR